MKKKSNSQSAFLNLRVFIGLFIALAGVFLALLGAGAFSSATAQGPNQNPGSQSVDNIVYAVPAGEPVAILNSWGHLEIAVREGSAAAVVPAAVGETVRIT